MSKQHFEVIVVGAGFAGLYLAHKLTTQGRTLRVLEQGSDVGGTWYWNRYPGARCDAESLAYSFSFSSELEQTWHWSERYAQQPEILSYARHVADQFQLRPLIQFNTQVTSAIWQELPCHWVIETAVGERFTADFCVMATGCLSVPQRPDIPGLETFAGNFYQASQWPHEPVGFEAERVGIIGTGSSGIQAIPVIAASAAHLTVFQRTPNFSVPANNYELDPDWVSEFKQHYPAHRANHRAGNGSGFGDLDILPRSGPVDPVIFNELSEPAATALLEAAWQRGGARFMAVINDTLMNLEANQFVQAFVHKKIRSLVKDPVTAAALCPTTHPIGTRRICVDINYYETYNQDHVRLVNLRETPLVEITPKGIALDKEHIELDTLVIATGFDAMTGALRNMNIQGVGGFALEDAWHAGPRTYLGLMSVGFPNLFMVTGPGSPSVLSNMLVSIEQHVDWIVNCLTKMRADNHRMIRAEEAAQDQWMAHVQMVAEATLFPQGGSWYLGANVPGKPRIFMPYAAGVGAYREACEAVVAKGYRGFEFA